MQEILNQPVSVLRPSVRVANVFSHAGIRTIGDVVDFFGDPKRVVTTANFGRSSFHEVKDALADHGITVSWDVMRDGEVLALREKRGPRIQGASVYLQKDDLERLMAMEWEEPTRSRISHAFDQASSTRTGAGRRGTTSLSVLR